MSEEAWGAEGRPTHSGMSIEEFEQSYFSFHRISDVRRKNVHRMLTMFEDFSGGPISEIDAEKFHRFLAHLCERGYNVNTVRWMGNCIRPYARHAWELGKLDEFTYLRLRNVRNPRGATNKSKPNPYTREELVELFAWLDRRWPATTERRLRLFDRDHARYYRLVWGHFQRLQIRAVIYLALEGGLRRVELMGLTVDDISPENLVIVVRHGKSEISGEPKYRDVPYNDRARAAVKEWLAVRARLRDEIGIEAIGEHSSPWITLRPYKVGGTVFSRRTSIGEKIPLATFGRIIRPWELHRLRHSCATFALAGGVPLEKVMKWMGHASTDQTLAYAKISRADVIKAAAAAQAEFVALTGGNL